MTTPLTKNHLAQETSPYLLQHVYNPVDWYPWSKEALTKAAQEGKPVLLSIGYSACHWCHVMAHESFEDPATAKMMNELFINIKVDREERPDLDKIYQIAHQMLTRRPGGWPLTLFLTPHDLTPFFAGTYFPNEPRYGMPNFKEILMTVIHYYHEQPVLIEQQNNKLREILQQFAQPTIASATFTATPIIQAWQDIQQHYDHFNGGFGTAPKFPQPNYLQQLLLSSAQPEACEMLNNTLTKMAQGGIYDHIGGGFYRYSVDAHWHIPHFEKMLYDNAQLLTLYAQAYQLTQQALFKEVLIETANWVQREMQACDGGYYGTLDADSEHKEGKFYVWDDAQVKALLTAEEYAVAAFYFNLKNPPNFEGHWNLHIAKSMEAIAQNEKLTIEQVQALIACARQKLFTTREQRLRPARDEKIITSWNGLMIQGMALAGLATGQHQYIQSAQRAVDFIRSHLWQNKRLLATYKDSQARFMAYLDDYAFLMNALLTLLQIEWRNEDLTFAIELADTLLEFYEDQVGGFYFTACDHEKILQRLKPFADEATPSGNGIAAQALGRLGFLLAEKKYLTTVEKTLSCAWELIQQAPAEHQSLLQALNDYLNPPEIIILRGEQNELALWQQLCLKNYDTQRLVFAIANNVQDLPPALAQKLAKKTTTAYICKGYQCSEAILTIAELEHFLNR